MKYFDTAIFIIFLVFGLLSSWYLLFASKNKKNTLMGISVLILTIGEAFPLIARIIAGYSTSDISSFTKAATTISYVTTALFLLLLFHVLFATKKEVSSHTNSAIFVYLLTLISIVLAFFPLENYFLNEGKIAPVMIYLLRSISYVLTSLILFVLYIKHRRDAKFTLTFAYILVAICSSVVAKCSGVLNYLDYFIYLEYLAYGLIIFDFIRNKNTTIVYRKKTKPVFIECSEDY